MTKKELQVLREVRSAANFDRASFDDITQPNQRFDGMTATEFIKDRTRLYRDSWVLPQLDELIAKYSAKLEKP